ncbi:hypothetical protein [Halocynthiibacter sp.]|uniref:hypothetical protein n=1 Tax=Halocynthiibacter sp. TaxID=1979210 RepID=UPI003C3B2065
MATACFEWGYAAIVAAMTARAGNVQLLHTPEHEAFFLDATVRAGLINSPHGIIDDNSDGFPRTLGRRYNTL